VGCPASISYKTYFETEQVRVMYISEHSHEIGLANLPFTKRGRKAYAEQQARSKTQLRDATDEVISSSSPPSPTPTPTSVSGNAIPGPSSPGVAGPSSVSPHPRNGPPASHPHMPHPGQTFQTAISMLAPLPSLHSHQTQVDLSQERWDRMSVLYGSIRDHARTFEYPAPSVAALESVLIRLYLESPMAGMPPPNPMGGMDLGMDGMHEVNNIGDPGHMGT